MKRVKKLLMPQEIEVHYIIPGIRSYLSRSMKEMGMKQSRIAELLEVDKATISQYLSKKRGSKVRFDLDISSEIYKSARLIKDRDSMMREIQRLVLFSRRNKTLCRVHREISGGLHCSPELERLCMTGGS